MISLHRFRMSVCWTDYRLESLQQSLAEHKQLPNFHRSPKTAHVSELKQLLLIVNCISLQNNIVQLIVRVDLFF